MTGQQQKIQELEDEVEYLKQQTRKKSLVISGLQMETDEDPEQAVAKLCKEKLKINLHHMDVDSVMKLRKKNETNTADLLITVTTYKKKIEILKEKNKLKTLDTKVYKRESHAKARRNIRRGQKPAEEEENIRNLDQGWTCLHS